MTSPDADLTTGLERLLIGNDGDDYIVGRPDLGVYVAVPEAGVILIRTLQAGEPLPVATARSSEVAGAEVDGEAFLAALAESGLLNPPEGREGGARTGDRGRRTREIRWIEGVPPQVARRLFGPVAGIVYAMSTGLVVAALMTVPDLRPSYESLWWLPDPILSTLLLLPVALLLAALHEAWHWLAGRAVGVPAIFRVSYRGIFLVFETDLTQIVAIPRRRRYIAFLAGMAVDVVVVAMTLALRWAHRVDLVTLPGWLDRLLAAITLVLLLGIALQWAALFMRSDGYAVVANALRCHDLHRATWLTTKDRLWRLSEAEATEYAAIGAHDRAVARWFGLVFLAGLIAMAWVMLAVTIPFLIGVIGWIGHNLVHPAPGSFGFWGSVAVVILTVTQYAVIPLLAIRERRLRRTGVLR